jgi:hypothetical protein
MGDFGGIYGDKPQLSEQDRQIEKETNGKMEELHKEMQPFYDECAKILKSPAQGDDSAQAKGERQKRLWKF